MNILQPLSSFACDLPQRVYMIPTWYKYLQGQDDPTSPGTCRVMMDFSTDAANTLVSVGLAVIEIMLFIAGLVAVAFIIYGGFRYVLSQGSPDNTKVAKDSILNALIGLVIAIVATTVVRFAAGLLSR